MTTATPEAREIQYHPKWGGYSNLPPVPGWKGKTYWARTTSLAKTLDDTYNLTQWKLRQVVWGIHQNRNLLDLIGDRIKPDSKAGKEILNAVVERALDLAGSYDGADKGTALHDLAEMLEETGAMPEDATPEQVRTLLAYREGLESEGIEIIPEYTERVVVCPKLGVAGRIDRIGRDADGDLKIMDLKSQKWEPGAYDSLALSIQLATYANAEWVLDHESWTWEAMPKVSMREGVIFWIPSGRPGVFESYDVDLELGLKFARAAAQLRKWRYQTGIVTKR
jgi:nucleotide-binding universal stress UspA family protein